MQKFLKALSGAAVAVALMQTAAFAVLVEDSNGTSLDIPLYSQSQIVSSCMASASADAGSYLGQCDLLIKAFAVSQGVVSGRLQVAGMGDLFTALAVAWQSLNKTQPSLDIADFSDLSAGFSVASDRSDIAGADDTLQSLLVGDQIDTASTGAIADTPPPLIGDEGGGTANSPN